MICKLQIKHLVLSVLLMILVKPIFGIRNGAFTGEARPYVGAVIIPSSNLLCSGVLIAPDVVLTAASCVNGLNASAIKFSNSKELLSPQAYFFKVIGVVSAPKANLALLRILGQAIPQTSVPKIWGNRPNELEAFGNNGWGSATVIGYGVGVNAAGNNQTRNFRQTGMMDYVGDIVQNDGTTHFLFQDGSTNQTACAGDIGGPYLFKGAVLSFVAGIDNRKCLNATAAIGAQLYQYKNWLKNAFFTLTGGRALTMLEPQPIVIKPPTDISAVFDRDNGRVVLGATDNSVNESGHVWQIFKVVGSETILVKEITLPPLAGNTGRLKATVSGLEDGHIYKVSVYSYSLIPQRTASSIQEFYKHVIWPPAGARAPSKPTITIQNDGTVILSAVDNSDGEIGFRITLTDVTSEMRPYASNRILIPAILNVGHTLSVSIPPGQLPKGKWKVTVTAVFGGNGEDEQPTDLISEEAEFQIN